MYLSFTVMSALNSVDGVSKVLCSLFAAHIIIEAVQINRRACHGGTKCYTLRREVTEGDQHQSNRSLICTNLRALVYVCGSNIRIGIAPASAAQNKVR